MLTSLRPSPSSIFWRTIYIVSALIVFSYILFDVLDLDGSNFRSSFYPRGRAVLVQVELKEADPSYVPAFLFKGLDITPVFSPNLQTEFVVLTQAEGVRPRLVDWSRAHRYRVALPRSSILDPSPLI